METTTLDDFVAWNDQLAALVQAGVPLDLGLGTSSTDLADSLKRINATVSRRVSRGESLGEAIQDDEEAVPPSYRALVELGLSSGNLASAIDGSNRVAESIDDSNYAVRSSFIYPLVVCFLALVGLVVFCIYFVPKLENMYYSLRVHPGSGLRIMRMLRDTMSYWVVAQPLAMLLFIVWLWRAKPNRGDSSGRRSGLLAWLPGIAGAEFQERCASFAEALATLLENDAPLADALPLAAEACGDAQFRDAAMSLAASFQGGQSPGDDSPAAKQFPPFLRWALLHSDSSTGRARALRMAASIYRQSAKRREERFRIVVPLVVCALLGGGVTLLYGLSLFVPVVQLLRALAS
jgi:type II secretory pathway component PulF